MNSIAKLTMLVMLGTACMSPASAGIVCLKPNLIDSTHVVNAKTILFRMKNGDVWRNTLRTPCNGLLFNGFQYTLHYDEICGTGQAIRILDTLEVCVLGDFTKDAPAHT